MDLRAKARRKQAEAGMLGAAVLVPADDLLVAMGGPSVETLETALHKSGVGCVFLVSDPPPRHCVTNHRPDAEALHRALKEE